MTRFVKPLVLGLAFLGMPSAPEVKACTLWGAAGKFAGQGTIVSKNRDWKPDHQQVLRLTRPENGYAYFGICTVYEGQSKEGLAAGINEKGLTVFTAATNLPRSQWGKNPGRLSFTREFLSDYASCDEFLTDKDAIFSSLRPTFVMIADAKKILMVEVGAAGQYALKVIENSVVVHSNHYLDTALASFNRSVSASSLKRYDRLNQLLAKTPPPFTTESFVTLSKDQCCGPDESLWRTGTISQTIASWIVENPAHGPPKLRVVLVNPGQPDTLQSFILDAAFWQATK
jgi:isopenicillin-N N-acyltransferase like protein